MARYKENKPIRITNNDKAFFQVLSKTGRCFAEDANASFNIRKSRLNSMIKNGYIEREAIIHNHELSYCYRLTKQGMNWVKQNISTVNKFYKSTQLATAHDMVLFKTLASKPKIIQDVAMTESDVIAQFGTLRGCSPPDLYIPSTVIIDENTGSSVTVESEIIEIITKHYKSTHIQSKINYKNRLLNQTKGGIRFIEAN